jgi:hypothetical protein
VLGLGFYKVERVRGATTGEAMAINAMAAPATSRHSGGA